MEAHAQQMSHSPAVKPDALVKHHSVGRTRIAISSRAHDIGYFERLAEKLQHYPGVSAVTANPTTGTVLILHRAALGSLFSRAQQDNLFSITLPKSKSEHERPARRLAQEIFGMTKNLDKVLLEVTGGVVDLQMLTAATLMGLSVVQARRGKLLPAGVPLFAQGLSLLNLARNSPE